MSDQSLRPASFSSALAELLRRAGLGKSSNIQVTGPAGLPALLWFCRHGYEHVGYVRGGSCPSESGDLVLALQNASPERLEALLARGPHPHAGGVLIVQTPATADEAAPTTRDLLRRHGYRIERRVRGRHRELIVARRQTAACAPMRKAA